MNFIGIDIGTTSICGVVLNTQGRLLTSVTRDNDSWLRSKHAWELIQDPARIERTVRRVIAGLLSQYPSVAGIGVTGQMHGIVYVDKAGQAVSPLYTWQDARGNEIFRGTTTYAGELAKRTGYSLAPGFGLVTHWYNARNRLVSSKARHFCTIQDYIVMRLAGLKEPQSDPTDAASLGGFDLIRNDFDRPRLTGAGVDALLLPELAASGTVVGSFSGIPICVALGDNQASFLGSVRNVRTTLLVNIGTGGQISAYSDRKPTVKGLDVRPFPGGGYLMVGALLCGGKAYAMLGDFFRKTLEFFDCSPPHKDYYSAMARARYSGLVDTLRVDTRFAGTRENPLLRGSISGISMDNLTPEHLIAGFLEGLTAELHDFYLKMPAAVRARVTAIAGSGNGLRKNPLLCRLVSRRFERKLCMPLHHEEASVGAALAASVGTGVFRDYLAVGKIVCYAGRIR